MKNAIVMALLLMRMVAEEIVKEAEGNQPQIWQRAKIRPCKPRTTTHIDPRRLKELSQSIFVSFSTLSPAIECFPDDFSY